MNASTKLDFRAPARWTLAAAFVSALFSSLGASAQSTTSCASVSSLGAIGDGSSFSPSVSRDGRFVAYSSLSTNLVANDTNFTPDVFVRDLVTNSTVRASVDSNGAEGDSISWFPSISGDGRFVAFTSFCTNLVPGDTNGWIDVFVHDMQTGQTTRESLDSSGAQANMSLGFVSISDDGRFVAFDGDATNLVPGDTNATSDVFLRDRLLAQTTRVSVSSGGVQGNGPSLNPSISGDGRYVVFSSVATNLIPNDTNLASDVFVHDTLTGQTTCLSINSLGQLGNGDSNYPALSRDGRFVSFDCGATNFVAGDTNGQNDIYVLEIATGQFSIASLNTSGAQGNMGSYGSAISAEGRFVSFYSSATTLAPVGPGGFTNVFLRDRLTNQTELVSIDGGGASGDDGSFFSTVSADGRVVAFESAATTLVGGDTNFSQDIFARDRSGPMLPSFCAGDGSGAACPCGNESAVGSDEGCLHSFGIGGLLIANGNASIASDSVTLFGAQMPNSSALYFQGTIATSGGAGIAFGDGLRCASGAVVRLATKINASGTSHFPEIGDPLLSVRGGCSAGDFRTYQVWYRNAAAFCTASTFNLTNGVQFSWAP
jgi:Tol biopolymer transport system component